MNFFNERTILISSQENIVVIAPISNQDDAINSTQDFKDLKENNKPFDKFFFVGSEKEVKPELLPEGAEHINQMVKSRDLNNCLFIDLLRLFIDKEYIATLFEETNI